MDQLYVGRKHSFDQFISVDLLDSFASTSGDFSKIHVDADAAIAAGFEGRVVHGALILSFFSRMIGMYLPGHSALVLECRNRFHKPVFLAETVSIFGEITAIHKSTRSIELKLMATGANGVKAVSGVWNVLIRGAE
jgi:3-hydroxybutyryl-CoA dehydratase